MQEREKEQGLILAPADPRSEQFAPTPVAQADAPDEDLDDIFLKAVAEIDTQKLTPLHIPYTRGEVVAHIACLLVIIGSVFGIVWQVITYPKTLVILYAREKPVSLTTTLDVATRTLAPVTLTRSLTTPTTGHGHQDALPAQGGLIFYNGQSNPQTIAIGTVFTGTDGVKVATEQTVVVPAANLPSVGETFVSASALIPGSQGNIAAFDINLALSSDLRVKNVTSFLRGSDARYFRAVARQDIQIATSTLQAAFAQTMPHAFPLAPGESAYPTRCVSAFTPDHRAGDEATAVTVHAAYTCQGRAYNSQELADQSKRAFTQTRLAPHYRIIGRVQTALLGVSPLSVTIHGTWAYTFSSEYEQYLAQQIEGDTPAQARTFLLRTGVISQANVPGTLPASMYIEFLVLAG